MTQSTYQSLAQAVEAYYEELRQFVRQRTGSASMAEEVLQETWIRATTTTLALPENPRAYLFRMASNLAVDQLRRQRVQLPATETGGESTEPEDTLNQLPCLAPSPEDIVISHREFAALTHAVDELPNKCREVFLLYRGHGLSMRQVAAKLGITEKTVEKHVARAMIHCRKRLREAGRNV